MPMISVIIPVYNKETYIKASLRSVLDQSFRDLEVIAVNDGSTDGSLRLLMEAAAADDRIRVVDIPNGGVSNARNVGLAHAAGRWIQFLDADDLLEPDYLARAMAELEANPADILFSGFTMVDGGMNPIREISLSETGMKDQRELCRCFARYQYDNGFFGYISNKLFSRSLWERSGAAFPVGTTLAEDLDFYVRMYPAAERALFWNGRSFRYLQTDENYTNRSRIDYYSQIGIHLDIRRWFLASGMYPEYKKLMDRKVAQYAYFILFHDNEDGRDLADGFSFLRSSGEIMACIDPACGTGFERRVLRCLKRGNLGGLKRLFSLRNGIRALYRRGKR